MTTARAQAVAKNKGEKIVSAVVLASPLHHYDIIRAVCSSHWQFQVYSSVEHTFPLKTATGLLSQS